MTSVSSSGRTAARSSHPAASLTSRCCVWHYSKEHPQRPHYLDVFLVLQKLTFVRFDRPALAEDLPSDDERTTLVNEASGRVWGRGQIYFGVPAPGGGKTFMQVNWSEANADVDRVEDMTMTFRRLGYLEATYDVWQLIDINEEHWWRMLRLL